MFENEPGMAELVTYAPRGVFLPEDAGVVRTEAPGLDPAARARIDQRTVFCDVFPSSGGDSLICVGPPFLGFGRPHKVTVDDARRRFAVTEGRGAKRASVLRVELGRPRPRSRKPAPLHVRVAFAGFAVEFGVEFPMRFPDAQEKIGQVSLTLVTIQKNNDPQWLIDWCAWHTRVHGVDRVVIYDNGSRDAEGLYAGIAERAGDFELVAVRWSYPYGPPRDHAYKFAQTAALNHCRLMFGPSTRWCISLDMDEYLFSTADAPLADMLEGGGADAVRLPWYEVPLCAGPSGASRPARCFDSPWRSRFPRRAGQLKYVYRPGSVRFNDVHGVTPEAERPAGAVRACLVEALRGLGAARAVRWAFAMALRATLDALPAAIGARGREPVLFFFHFRALNTGWKHPLRVRPAGSRGLVRDRRIGEMRAVLGDGDR